MTITCTIVYQDKCLELFQVRIQDQRKEGKILTNINLNCSEPFEEKNILT